MGTSIDVKTLNNFSGLAFVGPVLSSALRTALIAYSREGLLDKILEVQSPKEAWSSWDHTRYEQSLSSDNVGLYFLKDSPDQVRGFVLFRQINDEIEVLDLGVKPRAKGWGRKLMELFLIKAKDIGASKVMLEVSDQNIAAIKLYEHFSFQIVGSRPSYYRDKSSAIVYVLAL